MRSVLLAIVLTVATVGCNRGIDSKVVGSWNSPVNTTLTVNSDHTFSESLVNKIALTGTWSTEGNDITFVLTKCGKLPVQEAKAKLEALAAKSGSPKTRQIADDLDKPDTYTLSEDGKSLTTDAAKTKTSGPSTTYVKNAG